MYPNLSREGSASEIGSDPAPISNAASQSMPPVCYSGCPYSRRIQRNFDIDLQDGEVLVTVHLHIHAVADDLNMLGDDRKNFFPQN